MRKYEVFRKGNDPARDIKRYFAAVESLIDKLPTGDAYEFKRRGDDEWRSRKSKPALKRVLLDQNVKVGEAIYARRAGGRAVFVLRAIEVVNVPDCPVAGATAGIKEAWTEAYNAFLALGPGYEFVYMGGFVCRRIDNSALWSQHAHHNAFDFRIRKAGAPDSSIDVEATGKVARAVSDSASQVLWQVSGHFYHAHVSGDPLKLGTPACA